MSPYSISAPTQPLTRTAFTGIGLAHIRAGAPAVSREFQEAAAAIHRHLLDRHPAAPSTGTARELEGAAAELHHTLDTWDAGAVNESEVADRWEAMTKAWRGFRRSILGERFLHGLDPTPNRLLRDTWRGYAKLSFYLWRVEG